MKTVFKTYYFFAIMALFGSCKVGQKYQRPDSDMPHVYRGAINDWSSDSSNFSKVSWQEFFHDPILKNLIDSALKNNYDMRIALKNIEIANRNLNRNKLDYLPTVDATVGSVNRQYRSREFYSNPSGNYYGDNNSPESLYLFTSQFASTLNFSWEIDIWGKIANQRDQLKADFLNTYETKNAIQTRIIADIAKSYFNLQMLDAQIEVSKRNLGLNDSTLQMIKLQFEAGEITALAIQQTESQRLLAASLIPELEKEIAIQENALKVLTGEFPDRIDRSQYLDTMMFSSENISLGSPIDIIRNRPDIRASELDLIAANAEVNINQIMRYPQLTLGGAFGVNAMLPKNWFNIPGALLGSILGDLTAPVFRNGRLKNNFEVAKLEREKVELAFQQNVREAVNEIADVVITIDKQKEQLSLAMQRVENSQLAVKNASLLFRSGYASYLEVITAQSNALQSDLDLVEIKQKQLNAYVDLYRSLGGGWNN